MTNFLGSIYRRLRGPLFRIGQIVPYYGGATIIRYYYFKDGIWLYRFAHSEEHSFSENLVTFYLDNPNESGRSYASRREG